MAFDLENEVAKLSLCTSSGLSSLSGPLPLMMTGQEEAGDRSELQTMLTTTRLCSVEAKSQPQGANDSSSGPKRRLFVDHLEPNVNEASLLDVFRRYGQVQEVSLFRDAETCSSTGAGFVTFTTTDGALAAMEGLDGKAELAAPGSALVVEWALGSSSTLCTKEQEEQRERRARTLFFAKVPPNVSAQEIEQLFALYGAVSEVNLFKAWAGAKSSKGCGLVEFATREGAEKSMEDLHLRYCWQNTESAMVVEWMNQSKQRSAGKADSKDAAAKAEAKAAKAAEACKLLVGNLPVGVTKEQLIQVFSPWGTVVNLGVSGTKPGQVVDGTGYVRFATKEQADAAVAAFKANPLKMFDPTTGMHRVVCVVKPISKSSGSGPKKTPSQQQQSPKAVGGGSKLGHMMPYMLLQQQQAAAAMAQQVPRQHRPVWHTVASPGGAMVGEPLTVDVCEAWLHDSGAGSQMDVPVHVQPVFAAQMYTSLPNTIVYRTSSASNYSSSTGPSSSLSPLQPGSSVSPTGDGLQHMMLTDPISMSDQGDMSAPLNHNGMSGNLPYLQVAAPAPAQSWQSNQKQAQQQHQHAAQGGMQMAPTGPYPLILDMVGEQSQHSAGSNAQGNTGGGVMQGNMGGPGVYQQYNPMLMSMGGAQGRVMPGTSAPLPVPVREMAPLGGPMKLPAAGWGGQAAQGEAASQGVVPVSQEQAYALADHLPSVSAASGAQVMLTGAPNGGLQLLLVGRAHQRDMAHSLLTIVLQNNMGINMGVGTL